jgi:hypothetical protein
VHLEGAASVLSSEVQASRQRRDDDPLVFEVSLEAARLRAQLAVRPPSFGERNGGGGVGRSPPSKLARDAVGIVDARVDGSCDVVMGRNGDRTARPTSTSEERPRFLAERQIVQPGEVGECGLLDACVTSRRRPWLHDVDVRAPDGGIDAAQLQGLARALVELHGAPRQMEG